jgi:hypothetical protein
MKRLVEKQDASKLVEEFPLAELLPNWFFRVRETSAGAYLAEGTDLWGRTVSRQGGDPDLILQLCVMSARAEGV